VKNIHQAYIQESFLNFIGLPYEKYDCYQLVKLFYQEIFNHNLFLPYIDTPQREKANKMINEYKINFTEVKKPIFGDIILFNISGLSCHLGIYLNDELFLHTTKATGCVIERLKKYSKRIEGYYKCLKLKQD